MTSKTRADFKTDKDTALPDNTAGDISAADLRGEFDHLVDSAILPEDLLDEDNMVSDSATAGATQQSIKAYVDTTALLDSEVTNLAQVKAFDSTDYAAAAHTHEGTAILSAGPVTDGYVLTSDGAGGAAWEAVPSGGAPEGTSVLSTGPVTDGYVLTADGAGAAAWEAPAGGAPEGTAVVSTGESTGVFLGADGDNTSSWQAVSAGVVSVTDSGDYFTGTDVEAVLAEIGAGYQVKLSEGAFSDGDKTKLDTIEDGADQTDEGNVLSSLSGATLTEVDPASADKILILDASDSFNIANATWSDVAALAGSSGTSYVFSEVADHPNTPTAAYAELWVTNDTDQKLIFTDDQENDKEVAFVTGGTDLSAYTGILGLNSGTAVDVNTKALLEARLSDVSDLAEADGDVWTGVHDFGGASSLEIPNSTGPTVDAAGEIAIDTSVANWGHGILFYHDGTEARYVMALTAAQAGSPSDQTIPIYNASTDIFEMSYVEGVEIRSAGPVTDGYVLTADGAGGAAWEAAGAGTVDTSGTPEANDFARFTDANTIEGRSYSEVRSDLGLVIGTNVEAADADILKADTADQLTAGFTAATDDDSTAASPYTPDHDTGNYKRVINDGAMTINGPSMASGESTSMVILLTNTTGAGAITFGTTTDSGDIIGPTTTDEYLIFITAVDVGGTTYSHASVKALQ